MTDRRAALDEVHQSLHEEYHMTIDNESPAGAWKDELKAAPWAYGQATDNQVRHALAAVRAKGLWVEAGILEQRIVSLEVEIERAIK